jgi:hypothetical protein
MLDNIFLFLDFFQHFSRNVTTFLINVGFVNYFFQHFVKCCKYFSETLKSHASTVRRWPTTSRHRWPWSAAPELADRRAAGDARSGGGAMDGSREGEERKEREG